MVTEDHHHQRRPDVRPLSIQDICIDRGAPLGRHHPLDMLSGGGYPQKPLMKCKLILPEGYPERDYPHRHQILTITTDTSPLTGVGKTMALVDLKGRRVVEEEATEAEHGETALEAHRSIGSKRGGLTGWSTEITQRSTMSIITTGVRFQIGTGSAQLHH